jgi:alanine racemase
MAIGGRRCPIVGRVSMDLTTVDVTEADPRLATPGGWAELIGQTVTLEEAGATAGTIGYEILTRLARRFHRVYTGGV